MVNIWSTVTSWPHVVAMRVEVLLRFALFSVVMKKYLW